MSDWSQSEAHRALMALPLGVQRNRLRDVVRGSGDALARRAHRFLSMADDYNERAAYERLRAEREPSYAQRLQRLTGHLFTRQSPAVLKIPTECTDTASYVAAFDRANHLAPIAPARKRARRTDTQKEAA